MKALRNVFAAVAVAATCILTSIVSAQTGAAPVAQENAATGDAADRNQAENTVLPADQQGEQQSNACDPIAPEPIVVPKLTDVIVRIDATLGSKLSTTGQTFGITLVEPLVFEGSEIIPAGTSGVGEVIHAKKAGGSGSGGELILAADYLDFEGRKIPLRSMRLGVEGKDQIGLAMAVGVAAGLFGFAVRGKNVDVAEGTLATAKLAEDTEFTPAMPAGDEPNECSELGEMEE